MKILGIGTQERLSELAKKISPEHELVLLANREEAEKLLEDDFDLVIDLQLDEYPGELQQYARLSVPVLVGAVKKSLSAMVQACPVPFLAPLFGINALPTFLDRSLTEVSSLHPDTRTQLDGLSAQLNWSLQWVEDRAGMVTPRVVFMIINEAFYTVQEGTAGKKDIDIAMKLGTNYPMGPFEWAEKAGICNVYETLEALYQDTHEERYKICPLLKTAYLEQTRTTV